ncbi:hypothetical protein L5515_005526 [Caenorhabditis briggsae]|uniref:Nuclear receptor domain-containing protein n=1 Tax=Caenorhabditis briggsae TaxID=6238 RepID=A0AAE9ENM8_CAEBR|nr:hypothetical protein L5515_005526 [Caenorhabditis briggsae]
MEEDVGTCVVCARTEVVINPCYNAESCEACVCLFRRYIDDLRSLPNRCVPKMCTEYLKCHYCRFQKCLEVGMINAPPPYERFVVKLRRGG